jgi:decaprenylphospho-beta-D-erythro-pentofuranosid-2-ulose 2-reductase
MKNILIVGATSLIAEHCARLWVREPSFLTLVGRDPSRLERVAQDLRVRSPQSRIDWRTIAFDDPAAIADLARNTFQGGCIDIALIAHGALPEQEQCEKAGAQSLALVRDSLQINAVSPALIMQAVAERMREQGGGSLAVIGSVAGDRGRRSNYVYGAAKALLDRHVEGLQHRFAAAGQPPVRVTLVKPGPTATPMTAGLQRPGVRLADPARVALDIVHAVATGRRTVYTPGIWRWIMLVIRHIPARIFGRLNF